MLGFARRASVLCARILCVVSLACLMILQGVDASEPGGTSDLAKQILRDTGVTGGVAVHLNCGDGRLTAALRGSDNLLVQGLDADAKNVEAARAHIRSLGRYGKVSVEQWSGTRLPYIDNLLNLVVAEDLGGVSEDEVIRVLAPLGVAYIKRGGRWTKTVKPWPPQIDEWQQHFHDADNNAVARDSLVGPPRHYQWIAEPHWMRSHFSLASLTSMVSSQGRLFVIEDRASAELPSLPGKYALVAHDAFNGSVLWVRPFPDWRPIFGVPQHTPSQLSRRLAAVGDTVYCTPGLSAPLTAFAAATGRIFKTYKGTESTQEFVTDQGTLYVIIGGVVAPSSRGDQHVKSSAIPIEAYGPSGSPTILETSLVALQADTGEKLWQLSRDDTTGYLPCSLAVQGPYVVYCTADAVVCRDRSSGAKLWSTQSAVTVRLKHSAPSVVLSDSLVFIGDDDSLRAMALKDGALLWTNHDKMLPCRHKAPDVFLAGGLVWSGLNEGHNPQTGEVVTSLAQKLTGYKSHYFCYRNRMTDRYYINTVSDGTDFLGLDGQGDFPNPWVRGTCGLGILPCNGLLYAPPHACVCANWTRLDSLSALAPESGLKSSGQAIPVETHPRLEKGPAYSANPQAPIPNPSDWPTYRHDASRSGVTRANVPANLTRYWEAKLTTRPSAPVIAAGKVFVADVDAHAVCALDASDGRELWRYTVGARVDSPPTFHQGLLLFGSRDGWAYCLRAGDGALVWRFKDLPDRMINAYGQLESAWPVCGSILVQDDLSAGPGRAVAYFAAGRHSFLDGGIFLYGLDPLTGRVIHRRHVYGPYGEDGYPIYVASRQFAGFKNDVFQADEPLLFLRHEGFNADLSSLGRKEVTAPRMIPSAGFLDATVHHRTFWTIDTTLRSDGEAAAGAAHGDIMVKDGNRFYEVRGYLPGGASFFDPWPNGYTLYAAEYSTKDAAETAGKESLKLGDIVSSERWKSNIPLTGRAMALADDVLFVAGTPVVFPADDLAKAYEGRMGGVLWAASAATGEKLAEYKLDAAPAWDSMAVSGGRLYLSLQDGRVTCMSGK